MALKKVPKLPTHLDLPAEDGIPMEDRLHHYEAANYLQHPLDQWMKDNGWQGITGCNAFVYYDLKKPPVGPDFFCVNGGVEQGQGSWVVYSEGGLYPTLLVELPSPSTEEKDWNKNFRIYQDVFAAPDYFIYDVRTRRLHGFRLGDGDYVPVEPDENGLLPCASLPLRLGVRDGWLRWFTLDGQPLPIVDELTLAERQQRQRAETAEQRAEAAERRADELARRLSELERASGFGGGDQHHGPPDGPPGGRQG